MARIDGYLPLLAEGVRITHQTYAGRGWFEGHALIAWLNTNHNTELNDIYDLYYDAKDPQMTGDQQIGKSLYKLGQEKVDDIVTDREIDTPVGNRNGRCMVTQWRINAKTKLALGVAGSPTTVPSSVRPAALGNGTAEVIARIKASRARNGQDA